jgi:hypothetical protein
MIRGISTAAAGLLAIVVVASPHALFAHAGNSDPNVVHACIHQGNNQARIVGVNGSCSNAEVPVHWSIVGPQGPAGPQGATGAQGAAGPQGATGGQGPAGPAGPQGTAGPQGDTGAQGAAGPAGAQGATGPQGDTGAQGPVGLAGPQGVAGPQGDTGAQGPTGPAGPQGVAGPYGDTGAQGPAGPTGLQGSAGPTGPQGSVGPTGPQGSVGPLGPQGPQGPQGVVTTGVWNGSQRNVVVRGVGGGFHFIGPTTFVSVATNGQRITASGTLTLGSASIPFAYSSNLDVQGGVCARTGANFPRPLGEGTFPVTEPTSNTWNTFPGSASAPVEAGTWEVGMCSAIGSVDWNFFEVRSKGYAQVTQ